MSDLAAEAPRTSTIRQQVDPVVLGSDTTTEIGGAPEAGVVKTVTYTPAAAITGAATNNRTFTVVNKLQDGTGTTVVATLNMANAVNIAASDEGTITLSATPANLVVAAGDVLAFTSVHVGTGIADPGGVVTVTIGRT